MSTQRQVGLNLGRTRTWIIQRLGGDQPAGGRALERDLVAQLAGGATSVAT